MNDLRNFNAHRKGNMHITNPNSPRTFFYCILELVVDVISMTPLLTVWSVLVHAVNVPSSIARVHAENVPSSIAKFYVCILKTSRQQLFQCIRKEIRIFLSIVPCLLFCCWWKKGGISRQCLDYVEIMIYCVDLLFNIKVINAHTIVVFYHLLNK